MEKKSQRAPKLKIGPVHMRIIHFEKKGGKTLLKVDMDSNQQFREYFSETYPKALERLKTNLRTVELEIGNWKLKMKSYGNGKHLS